MYFYKLIELNRKEKNVTGEVKEIPEDEKKFYENALGHGGGKNFSIRCGRLVAAGGGVLC